MRWNNIVLICNLLEQELVNRVGEGDSEQYDGPLLHAVVLPWVEEQFPSPAVSPVKYTDYDEHGYIIHHFVCAFGCCQKRSIGYRSDRAFCSAKCRKRYFKWRNTLLDLVNGNAYQLSKQMQTLGVPDNFGAYLEKLLEIHQQRLARLKNA